MLVKEVQGGFDSFWIFKGNRDTVQYSINDCGLNGDALCWYGPKLLIIYSSVKPKECCQGTKLSLCGKKICLSASLWFGNILLLSSIKPLQSNTIEWCSTSEHTYVLSCTVLHLHSHTLLGVLSAAQNPCTEYLVQWLLYLAEMSYMCCRSRIPGDQGEGSEVRRIRWSS